jgi:hypothetical protein
MDDIARMSDAVLLAETRRVRAEIDSNPDADLISRYQSLTQEFASRSGGTFTTPVTRETGRGIQPTGGEYSRLDDFDLIEERRKVMNALAALTDRYRALNREMTRRETLRWMVAS